jgi:tetratricopeptide (TPR) repeat protein
VNSTASPAPSSPAPVRLAAAVIVVAALLAYAGSLAGPFLFDDVESIAKNPAIRHFSSALSPPLGGLTVSGRPLLNLSFAINYAISGTEVWSYHALNLLIHIFAGLTLFGVVRRTLAWRNGGKISSRSTALAFAVALLWTLHPLQTESVTYIVQRAESMMGLFYLLTLYSFIRGVEWGRGETAAQSVSFCWLALSWLACLFGMGTKEVMVTAPAMVLLYDRTFVSGSFRRAWDGRRTYYLGLAGTWLLVLFLVLSTRGRGGTAGFATGMPWWAYGLTQFRAIAHYFRLSVWPSPLIFDYGPMLGGKPIEMVADTAVVTCLAAVSAVLFICRRPLGFLGIWCFLILLPSSSVVPVATETIAEHRMYLSLAAVLTAIVGGGWALAERLRFVPGLTSRKIAILGLAACGVAATILGIGTARRNDLYQSPRKLWSDSVRKLPENAGARNNLGIALAEEGDLAGAEAQYRAALAQTPDLADVHNNLGNVLAKTGRLAEAVENYQQALRLRAWDPAVHEGLGSAFLRLGRIEEARGQFEAALRLDPGSPAGHFDLGNVLDRMGQLAAAAAQYREALRLDPNYSQAWYNLANLLARKGQFAEAANAYASAVRLQPDFVDAHVNYGNVLTELNRTPEAIREFQSALRLQPNAADVHNNLGGLLAKTGQWAEARAQYEEALRLDPDYREARASLERIDAIRGAGSGP